MFIPKTLVEIRTKATRGSSAHPTSPQMVRNCSLEGIMDASLFMLKLMTGRWQSTANRWQLKTSEIKTHLRTKTRSMSRLSSSLRSQKAANTLLRAISKETFHFSNATSLMAIKLKPKYGFSLESTRLMSWRSLQSALEKAWMRMTPHTQDSSRSERIADASNTMF